MTDMGTTNVLVVDDEPDIRDAVCMILERHGCHTLTARSGHEALRLLGQERVEVVLLDLMMPDLSGLAVLRGIRRLCRRRPMPVVIVCSGYLKLVAAALQQGGKYALNKPFELEQLVLVVRSAIRETAAG